jgi:hypothetical protein
MNNNITAMIDEAVGGYTTVTASANRALTVANGTTDEARNAVLKITTGTASAAFNLYAPPIEKTYFVWNSTAYTCTFYAATAPGGTTAAGTGVAIPANKKVVVFVDTTNVIEAVNHVVDNFSLGGTLTVAAGASIVGSLAVASTASIVGTANIDGVVTLASKPILSTLTASQAVFSDGSKGLVSNAITGTGNVVMSTSPTLVTPILGTPTSGTLTSCTGLPLTTGVTSTLPTANGGTARTVGNYSVYDNEIHVGKNGNDTTGDGTLINPVLTITKALTLIGSGKNTVIIHPGGYTENPTVSSTNTTIATSELTGANTIVYGTLTLSAAARVSGLKMTNLTITGSGNTYISNCTVDTQVVKSGTNYVEIINSELQCVSGIQISGSGAVSIVGNKCWAVAVSNAGANVLIKDCYQVITPSVSAGTLQIDGSVIFAASPTSNAVTSSAGTAITLANSFVLNSAGTNVERVSLAGNYSILNLVYDKTNSTFAGTSLNAIDYFQYINADRVNFNGSTSGITGLIASAVAGTTSLTLPAATDTLVGRATTDTLTNKTLTSPTLTAPVLGTPASGNLANCTGLPLTTGVTSTLPTANGGTGLGGATPYTANGVVYASSASALATGSSLTFDGTTLTAATGSKFQGFYAPRVVALADSSPATINSATTDIATLAYTAVAGTLTIGAPSGTPVDGQILVLRLKTTNAQTLSWNAIFQWSTDLPVVTTSSANKYDYFGFIYNSASSGWQVLAKNAGF